MTAFYQEPKDAREGVIRCHGRRSVVGELMNLKAAILITRRLYELQQQLLHAFTMLRFTPDDVNDVNFTGT
jgi:hypothetical protein